MEDEKKPRDVAVEEKQTYQEKRKQEEEEKESLEAQTAFKCAFPFKA